MWWSQLACCGTHGERDRTARDDVAGVVLTGAKQGPMRAKRADRQRDQHLRQLLRGTKHEPQVARGVARRKRGRQRPDRSRPRAQWPRSPKDALDRQVDQLAVSEHVAPRSAARRPRGPLSARTPADAIHTTGCRRTSPTRLGADAPLRDPLPTSFHIRRSSRRQPVNSTFSSSPDRRVVVLGRSPTKARANPKLELEPDYCWS